MKNEFGLTTKINWDRKADRTHVYVKFSAPLVFRNSKNVEWEKYVAECRKSLHRVAAEESIEILVWSIDLDWEEELTLITHHVYARGLLPGVTPNRIARALRPTRGYATLDALARALKNDLPVYPLLKRAVESNRLQRHDRNRKRLADPIPAHLLALALGSPEWRRMISPCDKPWAYINRTTRHIYRRSYAEGIGSANPQEVVTEPSHEQSRRVVDSTPAGDELAVENIFEIVQNSGCSKDATIVEMARAQGKTRIELPAYLTVLTGTSWDRRRVETARGSLRRKKGKLRASALANSRWRPRPYGGSIYRERLPDGSAWNGLWTYSHSLKADDLEIYREVMSNEREKLFRTE